MVTGLAGFVAYSDLPLCPPIFPLDSARMTDAPPSQPLADTPPPEERARLLALMAGNVVIGTGVMVVPATLVFVSEAMDIPIARAGLLVSAGGLVMGIGAPVLAMVVARWDRRRLLTLSLGWYGAMHLLCTLAPGFVSLLLLRIAAVLSPAVYTPQAAASVGQLVPLARRGKAITTVFLGWSVASVLGMPGMAWMGGHFGWAWAWATVGVASLLVAIWVWRVFPDGIRPPALDRKAWAAVWASKAIMTTVLVTALSAGGQFVLFAFLAAYYRDQLGVSVSEMSLMFALFGAFGLAGNAVMSRYIDRVGSHLSAHLGLGLMLLSLLLWPLGTSMWSVVLVSIPWGLGCFATNSAQQARLVDIAPELASGSIAMNTSAMYAGQAVGSAFGAWMIYQGWLAALSWPAALGTALALMASLIASRLPHRPKVV